MKYIGIISDTHGSNFAVEQAKKAAGHVDCWLHLGDFASDSKYLEPDSCVSVKGNCDALYSQEPTERVVEFDGVRILMVHGHELNVNHSTSRLVYRAAELNCKVALYGHTHIPECSYTEGILVVNPGSAARPLCGSNCSIATLTIDNGTVNAKMHTLK